MTDVSQTERSVSRRWTLYDQSEDYHPLWVVGTSETPAFKYAEAVEVMPVAEHEAALERLRELLPKVYDGMHLTDCPYVDVLLRIKEALDA